MKKIFEPVSLGNLQIKNRIIRSATLTDKEGLEGKILPYEKELCAALSKGNVGLIITGMMGVGKNSCAAPFMPRIYLDGFAESFREVAEATHENGGKIVIQLGQCGANTLVVDEGEYPLAPSDIIPPTGFEAKAMTREQIAGIVKDFGKAAKICKDAGADGVQIHCAHGYLLSEFLSPYYNKREDEYGGSIENRARAVLEVYDEVRAAVGKDYPVLIKINYTDLIEENGLTAEDSTWVCKELSKRGIDAIELSSGLALTKESRPSLKVVEGAAEGHFTAGALALSAVIPTPVISVGGYRSKEQIERVLNEGNIAAIAICRPFVNPMFIADWNKD
ncbi:MAG: NADH:flavin oxidoreductase [Oscillospiraceae bacterium]